MDIQYMRVENTSVSDNTDYIEVHSLTAIPYLVIIALATMTGTVGNIMVICAVWIEKELRVVGNMFIVNLAIADLCVTAIVNPFSIIGTIKGEVWFEDKPALCEFVACLCLTACFCSLLSIGAISLNRYIHICQHQHYQRIYTVRHTLLMCGCLWCVSFLAEMSNFFGWGDHVYDKKTLSCVWDRTADLSYSIFFSTVGVAFPVFLISFCYFLIYRHVRASRRKVAAMSAPTTTTTTTTTTLSATNKGTSAPGGGTSSEKGGGGTEAERKSKQLAFTFFLIFIVFVVCWIPYAFVVALDYNDTYPQEVHFFVILLAHTNSSLNSVLYGVSNKNFRNAYLRILGLKRCFA